MTCHRVVSTILKVHTSPTLIPLSRQNLWRPLTWWLLLLYGTTRACQDVVLLIEVLRVILQGSLIPIALQKTGGKYCTNCNHNETLNAKELAQLVKGGDAQITQFKNSSRRIWVVIPSQLKSHLVPPRLVELFCLCNLIY